MLAMLLFSFLFLLPCMGFQPALKVRDLDHLTAIELSSNKVRITEGMHTIIDTMYKVEKLPSCQKLASQALLNTCSEIDHATTLDTNKGIDVMLERSKSIYATRLAICELMDANAKIPSSCSPFRPVEQASKFNGFRGFIINGRFARPTAPRDFEDNRDLDQCSASLSSNPVWWTSYSNARQNAVLLCHSMRAELDKDDLIEKVKLMLEAVTEASNVMADTTEEHRMFERQWTEMGKNMQSFHLALNTDLDMQNRIAEQWAKFRVNIHDLDDNIQNLSRDVERVREASSHITSDLESHRLRAQEAQADVTQHLSQALDIAIQIDQSHDNSLAASVALAQQNHQLALALAHNTETTRALQHRTDMLLEAISTVTENVTDAARTVSEFHNDIHNLPTRVVQQVFEASLASIPFACISIVLLSFFWCLGFAAFDTWGPFRARSSVVASLGFSIATTHLVMAIPQVAEVPAISILGILAVAVNATFVCKLWYKQQKTSNQPILPDNINQDLKYSASASYAPANTGPLLS